MGRSAHNRVRLLKVPPPPGLSIALAAIMAVQAALGLALPDRYRDAAWIKAAWFGNDGVTLLVAVPLFAAALLRARRGSVRALLVWLGTVAYVAYNYAYYAVGAALNVFFPLYVGALVLSVFILFASLTRLDIADVSAKFPANTPTSVVGTGLALIGTSLGLIWIALWAAYVFFGRPTPVEPEAFKIVAALDLALMVPPLTLGGLWLRRKKSWGYVLAAMAAIQATLYLLVLSVGSYVAVRRGLAEWPGELPIWVALAALTGGLAFTLLAHVRESLDSPGYQGGSVLKRNS